MARWHLSTASASFPPSAQKQPAGSHQLPFPLSRVILALLAHRLVAFHFSLLQPQPGPGLLLASLQRALISTQILSSTLQDLPGGMECQAQASPA